MTTLTRDEFSQRFEAAVESAFVQAEQHFGQTFSREIEVKVHGAGYPGRIMSATDALAALYLGPDKFYRIIDVAVIAASSKVTRIFVRASGHLPSPLDQCWDEPPGTGPFQAAVSMRIKQLPD